MGYLAQVQELMTRKGFIFLFDLIFILNILVFFNNPEAY